MAADNPAAFLEMFLWVIAESRRTTTYKPLLVLALLDAVRLTAPRPGEPTRLRLKDVAERAVHLLWWPVSPRLLARYLDYLRGIHAGLDGLAAEAHWYSQAAYSISVLHSAYLAIPGGTRRVWELGDDRQGRLLAPDPAELREAIVQIGELRLLVAS